MRDKNFRAIVNADALLQLYYHLTSKRSRCESNSNARFSFDLYCIMDRASPSFFPETRVTMRTSRGSHHSTNALCPYLIRRPSTLNNLSNWQHNLIKHLFVCVCLSLHCVRVSKGVIWLITFSHALVLLCASLSIFFVFVRCLIIWQHCG
jgi:hypothetical protein